MDDLDDVVNRLLRLGPSLMASRYPGVRVCVLATRVAVEVLRYFGLQAKPWPCRVVAMNSIAADAYGQSRPLSETWLIGGYALGQDGSGETLDGDGSRWDGHLVPLIEHYGVEGGEETALLLDLSLGDYSRPAKAIHAAPLRAMVPQRMIDERARVHIPLAEEGIAMYEPLSSGTWRSAPDWCERRRWQPLATELIRALRDPTGQ